MPPKDRAGDVALLRFLARAGLITADLARTAEPALTADSTGLTAIDWLTRQGGPGEEQIARAMAQHLRLPYVNLAVYALNAGVTGLLPEELATRYQIVPLRASEGSLVVATANPMDRGAVHAVGFATGRRVFLEVACQTAVRDMLAHAYHLEQTLDSYLSGIPDGGDIPVAELPEEQLDLKSLLRETHLAPVVKLFNLILIEGIRNRASDAHIEAGPTDVRVRYRIDGSLEESFRLPKWTQDPLVARCKVLAKLDITERRVPQDGHIRLSYRESTIDLRVSCLPTQFGEKLTLRILDPSSAPTGLDSLGFSERDLGCIREAINRTDGMILVTGPTGSGKTTTLYGMLAELSKPTANIVTIENPIEYQIRGVNQVEVNEKQGLTFAGTLRSILRQDPDIILVGEIRDQETAETALRAAQTGHLLLSTLHTNDAASTITRLVDLGVEPYMLASSLHLVIAQRLVRRTCTHCADAYDPEPEALRKLQIEARPQSFHRGRGCPACRNSGLSGRIGIFEVIPVSPGLGKLIETRASESALRVQAAEEGMQSLAEHAASRVCAGITTAEEVLGAVDLIDETARCPGCGDTIEETFTVCPQCGVGLHANCGNCGVRLRKKWHICPQCGTSIPGLRVAAASVPTPPAAAAPAPPSPTVSAEPPSSQRFRVLVVDDNEDQRTMIAFTLGGATLPFSVTTASNGQEALDLVQAEAPHVILLDVMMPGMDGFEVCARLRADVRTAFIPIMMLTALADDASREHAFRAGTDDYIRKPFSASELLTRVERILERTYGASFRAPSAVGIGVEPYAPSTDAG